MFLLRQYLELKFRSRMNSYRYFYRILLLAGAWLFPEDLIAETIPLPTPPRDQSQMEPAVAQNGDIFLLVWMELNEWGEASIFGRRLHQDGSIMDQEAFRIGDGNGEELFPCVAPHGEGFLVVWSDTRNMATSFYDIYASRISRDGAVLDPIGFPVNQSPGLQFNTAIAHNGSESLIVWQDGPGYAIAEEDSRIRGTMVKADGRVQPPRGFLIGDAFMDQSWPSVASNGQDFLVVWNDFRSGVNLQIAVARVTSEGDVLDPGGRRITTHFGYDQQSPSVAYQNGHYLVAWEQFSGPAAEIYGLFLNATGDDIDSDPFLIGQGQQHQLLVSLAAGHGLFYAAWQDGDGPSYGGTSASIKGAVISQNQTVVPGLFPGDDQNALQGEFVVLSGSQKALFAICQDQTAAGTFALHGQRITPNSPSVIFELELEAIPEPFTEVGDDVQRVALAAAQEWGRHFKPIEGIVPALDIVIAFESLGFTAAYAASETTVYIQEKEGLLIFEEGAAYEIRTGIDPNGSHPDIRITLNTAFLDGLFWFDPDPESRFAPVPQDGTVFDFYSIILHELQHALGMHGDLQESGERWDNSISLYDQLVERGDQGLLYFTGESARSVFGAPVPLTRGNYRHVGNRQGAGKDLVSDLMHSPTDCAQNGRCNLSRLDLAILRDLGLPVLHDLPLPRLTKIQVHQNGDIQLSWDQIQSGMRIQGNEGLHPSDWKDLDITSGTTSHTIEASVAGSSRFFRLVLDK